MKKSNIEKLREEVDFSPFQEDFERHYFGTIQVVNSGLIPFFWKIGSIIIGRLDEQQILKKTTLNKISHSLQCKYGAFFSISNLKRMALLSRNIPDYSIISKIAPYITWQHICILSSAKKNEFLKYLSLVIEHGVTVKKLKEIYLGSIENRKDRQFFLGPNKSLKSTSLEQNNFDLTIQYLEKIIERRTNANIFNQERKNILSPPLLFAYQSLLMGEEKTIWIGGEKTIKSDIHLEKDIVCIIEEYRFQNNRWLNANFNLFFWRIGIKIRNEELEATKKTLLRNKLGSRLFDGAVTFASQFPDLETASKIAYLVSWEHILFLLELQDRKQEIKYAKLAAKQKLSIKDIKYKLSKQIKKSDITFENHAKQRKISKKINQTSIPESLINIEELNNNQFIPNFFKNKYFKKIFL